jgi:hypothetical protein
MTASRDRSVARSLGLLAMRCERCVCHTPVIWRKGVALPKYSTVAALVMRAEVHLSHASDFVLNSLTYLLILFT